MKTFFISLGLLLSRLCLSTIFLIAGFDKIFNYSYIYDQIAAKNLPSPFLLYLGAIVLEIVFGATLLLGFWTRTSALILCLYLIPTTFLFHDFWNSSPEMTKIQIAMFLKNIAIIGGLIAILTAGAGRFSLDYSRMCQKEHEINNPPDIQTPPQ